MKIIQRIICLFSRSCSPFDEKAKKEDPFILGLRRERDASVKRINFMERELEKGRE